MHTGTLLFLLQLAGISRAMLVSYSLENIGFTRTTDDSESQNFCFAS